MPPLGLPKDFKHKLFFDLIMSPLHFLHLMLIITKALKLLLMIMLFFIQLK
jgi:hypothetical protein